MEENLPVRRIKKRLSEIVFIALILFLIIIFYNSKPVYADVGDWESYDSGSSSSWDSGGSWTWSDSSSSSYSSGSSSDWSWDFSDDWDSSISGTFSSGDIVWLLVFFGISGGTIFFGRFKYNKKERFYDKRYDSSKRPYEHDAMSEDGIVRTIQKDDSEFNREEFLNWSENLFIKLQNAWSERDWSTIRYFETNELFEQHSTQLNRYKTNGRINKLEHITIKSSRLFNYKVDNDKEVLAVTIKSSMIDYIMDEKTEKIILGDKEKLNENVYKLTFIRKKGVKTKPGMDTIDIKNCPNCGAPTKIGVSGECSYCGSIVTTGEYNWVLFNFERMT